MVHGALTVGRELDVGGTLTSEGRMTAGSGVSAVTAEVFGLDIPGGVQNPACENPAELSAVCNEDRFIVGRSNSTVNGTADVLGRTGIAADTDAGDVDATRCLHVRGTATVAGPGAREHVLRRVRGRVHAERLPERPFAGRLRRWRRHGAALLDAFLALAVFAVLATAVALWLDRQRQRDLEEEAGRQVAILGYAAAHYAQAHYAGCTRDIFREYRDGLTFSPTCRPGAFCRRRSPETGCDAPGISGSGIGSVGSFPTHDRIQILAGQSNFDGGPTTPGPRCAGCSRAAARCVWAWCGARDALRA